MYYYLVGHRENPIPEGAVHAKGLLAPTHSDDTYTSDTAADLRTALELALGDPRNRSFEFEPEIVEVTFGDGHAQVRLQAEYSIGEPSLSRDVYAPFVNARMLILLTVFANPSVQSAAVSLNEDTIANLGISDSRDARPADYVFTRAEIEMYLKDQAYVAPTPIPTPTPRVLIDPSLPLPELLPNAIDLQWITAYGLPEDQTVTTIHPTRDGGFLLVGSGVLLKLRVDGFIEWQKSLGHMTVLDVLETSAGDFILAGGMDWIKLDAQGDILWQYEFGGPSYYRGPILRLVEEDNGNIVVEAAGSRAVFNAEGELQSITGYAMSWDSQTYPGSVIDRSEESLWAGGEKSFREYWVGKAGPGNGWLNVFQSPDYDIGPVLFIQTTADGGALIGIPGYEYVSEYLYFSYVVISRVSGDGSVRWQKAFDSGSSESQEDFHAFETRSGDFIVAGTVIDFGGGSDVWMSRLDRDGNLRSGKLYGTEEKDAVTAIQELSNGDLIFAGQTSGGGTGGQDMWVLKTDARGEIPNCGYVLGSRGGGESAVSSEVETIALDGVSVSERETIPVSQGNQRLDDAQAQVIPLCSPSP